MLMSTPLPSSKPALTERRGAMSTCQWKLSAPRGAESFHWHVDIAPRLSVKAGFELGSGVDINIYPPERAAADLREIHEGRAGGAPPHRAGIHRHVHIGSGCGPQPATGPALHRRLDPG